MKDFRPLNEIGAPVPNRHSRRSILSTQILHQCVVETRDGKLLPVGPKASRQFVEVMLVQINRMIAEGKELEWKNPHIIRAAS